MSAQGDDDSDEGKGLEFPVFMEGPVIRGFGRGSRLLGFPTANLPTERYESTVLPKLPVAVYFGWAFITPAPDADEDTCRSLRPPHGYTVHKMAMSIGFNPFFGNSQKTIEVHVLHKFERDFYGAHLKIAVVGYRRALTTFKSLEDLKSAIRGDVEHAEAELEKPVHRSWMTHGFFRAVLISNEDRETMGFTPGGAHLRVVPIHAGSPSTINSSEKEKRS